MDKKNNSKILKGIHIDSRIEHLIESTKLCINNGGSIIQLFVDPDKDINIYLKFKDFLIKNKIKCVVHASYTINLSRDWDDYSPWIHQFIAQINLAHTIGAFGIVVHMGKKMELSLESAYNNMYTSLLYVHNQTLQNKDTKILLETSTGQGSEICYKLEDLAYFYKKFSRSKNSNIVDRFGICVDTCHIFAAGYDLRTKASVYMYLEAFEELIGVKNIKLIHLNDSKKDIGSNVDRHDNIGYGKIGEEGLIIFAKHFINLEIPIILETPFDYLIQDLNLLK